MSTIIPRKKQPLTGILHFAFCLLPWVFSGCTDTHRENDWKDVFTGTVGEGYGFKLRVGPLQTGLYTGRDDKGLRAGITGDSGGHIANYDYYWLFYGEEHFDGWMDASEPNARRKVVAANAYFPFFVSPEAANPYAKSVVYGDQVYNKLTDGSKNYAYWTQIDFAIGLGDGLRFGFNPGELVDALVGYVGLDLYGDDTTFAEEKEKRASIFEPENPFANEPGVIPEKPPAPANR